MRKLILILCMLFPLSALGQKWNFTRATTAYTQHANGSLSQVPANVPRVANGVSVEGQATQLHGLTEAFNSWTQSGVCAVTADDHVAPDGTLTADLLDNTGGVSADSRTVVTVNLGDLTGRTFTGSIWIRADVPHICSIGLWEGGGGSGWIGGIQNVSVSGLWKRFSFGGTAVGDGTGILGPRIYPGENGVATGVAHFWGANLKELPFVDSYVPNAGAETTQVTRSPDSLTILPFESGTNKFILPAKFEAGTNRDKLTISMMVKGLWSANADMDSTHTILEISGNSGVNGNNRNRLLIYGGADGKIYAMLSDDASTSHYAYTTADAVVYDEWFKLRFVLDFSDLSRMAFYLNGSETGITYVANTGVADFDLANAKIRIGQNYGGTTDGDLRIEGLLMTPSEVRP